MSKSKVLGNSHSGWVLLKGDQQTIKLGIKLIEANSVAEPRKSDLIVQIAW